ncbi:MAG: hypothetical protein Q9227_003717 [Pyrenula ochraceoflavens]
MPKRRAPASAPESSESDASPPRRRRLNQNDDQSRSASPAAAGSGDDTQTQTQSLPHGSLIKKLVRYALSCEYARQPIRRHEISSKVLGEGNGRQFRVVFEGAQKELEKVFGMRMVELPGKEKTGLKERRGYPTDDMRVAAQSQVNGSKSGMATSSSKSYILTSTLSPSYRTALCPSQTRSNLILPPSRAPHDAAYTALYTTIIALLMLSPTASLPEAKLDRYLHRLNADIYTPVGKKEDLLKRMEREGYIERRREVVGGEEGVEFVVGPRGKVEVGVEGVAGLVRGVYGLNAGDGINQEGEVNGAGTRGHVMEKRTDIEKRLKRSLGIAGNDDGHAEGGQDEERGEADDEEMSGGIQGRAVQAQQAEELSTRRATRGRPRPTTTTR